MNGIGAVASSRRRTVLAVGVVAAVGFAIFRLQSGEAAPEDTSTVTATRGPLVVTVGGVGRIVQSRVPSEVTLPATASRSTGAAPADAVFPRAAARVSRYLVSPGQRVVAGQPLAVLDDGGVAALAVRSARLDFATALLELDQKRTSDPLRGVPASPAELAAARSAVTSARARLGRLQSPPRPADVAVARLEIRRAQAELETLTGGAPAARTAAIQIAEQNVGLAQTRLDRILQPSSPADVKLAESELKRAEAELAVLRRPQLTPSPEALAAAQLAIGNARADLAQAQRTNDPDQIREAQASLDSALTDLSLLLRPGPTALPQQISAAEAVIESARSKLERLQAPPNPADVAGARVELERARAELRLRKAAPGTASVTAARQAIASARARLAQLLGPPLAVDVRNARFELSRAQAELAVLKARGGPASASEIGLAGQKVTSARLRLEGAQQARRLLTVRAPWSGTVTSLSTARGAPVDMTTPVATVADLSKLSATVDLSEFDAAQVRRGLKASISVDALGGKRFPGIVRFASPTGINSGGVVIFPAKVALANASGLKPGMNVSVRIVVAKRRNVLQLPLEAVARDGSNRSVVTVVDESGETSSRRVKLGLANNQKVQILSGLRPGDRVELPEQPSSDGAEDGGEEAAGA